MKSARISLGESLDDSSRKIQRYAGKKCPYRWVVFLSYLYCVVLINKNLSVFKDNYLAMLFKCNKLKSCIIQYFSVQGIV